jgi:hypothetical protein
MLTNKLFSSPVSGLNFSLRSDAQKRAATSRSHVHRVAKKGENAEIERPETPELSKVDSSLVPPGR